MDDELDDARKALRRRMSVVVAAFALAVAVGADLAGERAVAPLLLAALVAVALIARGEAAGRSLLPQPAALDVPRLRDPQWYSERWVQEQVQRGLRSLEEWCREQPSR